MKTRIITAIIALCIFIPIVLLGNFWIDIAALALGIIALGELLIMQKRLLVSPEAIVSVLGLIFLIMPNNWINNFSHSLSPFFVFYIMVMILLLRMVVTHNIFSFRDVGVVTLSVLYVGLGFHYFIDARSAGITTIFYALFLVWSTDTGAYLLGRKFGKHKLSPYVSPNKTWEGAIGGSILATIVGTVWSIFFPVAQLHIVTVIIVTLLLSIVSQIGDLVESSIKRYYQVKDSGKILPGHGGILDRFDSLLFVLPILHLIGII